MADDRDTIPLAEQEAAMEGAPGYGTAMLAVAVIALTVVVLFAMIYLLMAAISPLESRDGKPRARPAAESAPSAPAPSSPPPAAPLTVPLPSPPPPR